MQDRGAERNALLPAAWKTTRDLVLLPFQSREFENPALLLVAFLVGDSVHAGEKVQVLVDTQIVVERELLRHVADLLAHALGPQSAPFTRQFHCACGRRE